MAKPRITIPTTAGDLIDLASSIEEQHTELGKDSPLALLDWKTASPQIKEASDVQDKINKLSKELEKLIERRNNLIDPLSGFVRSSRDILSGVFRSEMKKLSDFGFEVDDSPKAKKAKGDAPAK
ncbi:MAG: hypothetical protein AAB466_04620 [Verrucomicrobiota bacterium]